MRTRCSPATMWRSATWVEKTRAFPACTWLLPSTGAWHSSSAGTYSPPSRVRRLPAARGPTSLIEAFAGSKVRSVLAGGPAFGTRWTHAPRHPASLRRRRAAPGARGRRARALRTRLCAERLQGRAVAAAQAPDPDGAGSGAAGAGCQAALGRPGGPGQDPWRPGSVAGGEGERGTRPRSVPGPGDRGFPTAALDRPAFRLHRDQCAAQARAGARLGRPSRRRALHLARRGPAIRGPRSAGPRRGDASAAPRAAREGTGGARRG